MKPLGLYVHIPFCASKCAYCDFASWAGREQDMARYVHALCGEITARAADCGHPAADTVFFGGGTPSLLPPELFEKIARTLRASFALTEDAEWTVECNPGTLTPAFADALARCGVNRVSLGMQAAQSRLLRQLGRIHDMHGVTEAVETVRAAGITNISLDLMLGLPGQTRADMAETLDHALALSPSHLSCYALIVEEGTPLAAAVERGEMRVPGDEMDREMYALCRTALLRRGFVQYEISNFALPGRQCRHHVNCWRREDYLGFGCAAHSLWENERRANCASLDGYLAGMEPETESISPQDAMFESLMLGLRLTQGIDEADFARRHGQALWTVYGQRLQGALNDGRLIRRDGRVFLTERGMDVMNSVLVEAMA